MAVAGKPNKGHENVLKHAEKAKDDALGRLKGRVALFKRLVLERKENLIPLKGLPTSASKFLRDEWLPEDIDGSEVYVSRATLYKKQEEYVDKLEETKKLCEEVQQPKIVAKKLKESDDEITKLTIRITNLAEINSQLEEEYQQQISDLKTRISELLEENERLESIVVNRSCNVTSLF